MLTYCQKFYRMKSAVKIDTIQKTISMCFYTFILGMETSWDTSILSGEVFLNNFEVHRNEIGDCCLVCGRVRVVGKNAAFLCCYFVVKYTFGSAGSVCKSYNTILFSVCL